MLTPSTRASLRQGQEVRCRYSGLPAMVLLCTAAVVQYRPWSLSHPCFCEYKAYKLPGVAQPSAAGPVASQTVALLRPSAHAQRLSSLAWENEAYVQLTWNKGTAWLSCRFCFLSEMPQLHLVLLLIFWISWQLFIWYLVFVFVPSCSLPLPLFSICISVAVSKEVPANQRQNVRVSL